MPPNEHIHNMLSLLRKCWNRYSAANAVWKGPQGWETRFFFFFQHLWSISQEGTIKVDMKFCKPFYCCKVMHFQKTWFYSSGTNWVMKSWWNIPVLFLHIYHYLLIYCSNIKQHYYSIKYCKDFRKVALSTITA